MLGGMAGAPFLSTLRKYGVHPMEKRKNGLKMAVGIVDFPNGFAERGINAYGNARRG
jgi:hypothetical protein